MKTYTVVVLDSIEREAFERVTTSLTIAYPDTANDSEHARAVRALAGGADASHETLTRASVALERQASICSRESKVDYWTHHLSTTDEPLTPETPGTPLIANPYQMCEVLAQAREAQWQDAREAQAVVDEALQFTTPRPDRKREGV